MDNSYIGRASRLGSVAACIADAAEFSKGEVRFFTDNGFQSKSWADIHSDAKNLAAKTTRFRC